MARQIQVAVRDDNSGSHYLSPWLDATPNSVLGFDADLEPVVMAFGGSGPPTASTPGNTYTDDDERAFYVKVGGVWAFHSNVP